MTKLKAALARLRGRNRQGKASEGRSGEDVAAYLDNPENPVLVSFPRTGSHWLRMLLELYFERPSLPRVFYYPDRTDYLLLHTHDLELDCRRRNVIYLYRDPVATVYSQMKYHDEPFDSADRISYWSDLYGRHLQKWLCAEDFTAKKTVLTYEAMRGDLPREFAKALRHFDPEAELDEARLNKAAERVTYGEVKKKTPHDSKVMSVNSRYNAGALAFAAQRGWLVWEAVLADRTSLRRHFSPKSSACGGIH